MHTLKQIEKNYEVEKILYKGGQVWPILRIYYFFHTRNMEYNASLNLNIKNFSKKWQRIRQLSWGWRSFFKKGKYLCFSNSIENKLIDGLWQNKILFILLQSITDINYHERPTPMHCPHSKMGVTNAASTTPIEILAWIFSKFINIKKVEGFDIIERMESDLGLNIDYIKLLRLAIGYRTAFYIFLKWKNPKAVFLTDSYNLCHMGLIHSAKKLGIPTIEFQHGVINSEHPGYNFYRSGLSSESCPDYLFCFGENVKAEIAATGVILNKNIHVIGHAYLEHILKKRKLKKHGRTNSKPIVGITLQWTDESTVINFIKEVAPKVSNYEFILIPRDLSNQKYKNFSTPSNVSFSTDKDFYEMLLVMDIHVTTYSTCALEAPSLGVPNILLDFDGMATRYFSYSLRDNGTSLFVRSADEFIEALTIQKEYHDKEISNDNNVARNYRKNLKISLEMLRIGC